MLSPTTKKLGLGLVAGFLLSTIPTQHVQAASPLEYFKELTLTQKTLLITAICATPYFVYFFTRRPLTAPRFDFQKLVNGPISEKINQINYFIADIIFGWPRKDNKVKVVADESSDAGKKGYKLDVTIGQEPAGFLGVTTDCLESAAKSIGLPKKVLASAAALIAGLKYCSNLRENIKTSLTW
jgi:hypothetical protein